ncbi:MAG: hypothetical protein ACKOFW_23335, partial [Planctomycetaceae bacterium]
VDLLLRNGGAACELVELNPRLTTSYLGYRELADSGSCQPFAINDHEHPTEAARPDSLSTVPLTGGSRLAAALLTPNRALELNWRAGHFEYGAS